MVGECSTHGDVRNGQKNLVGNPEGRDHLVMTQA
jgi:hypothetical protein